MKITLKPDAKPIKQRLYCLNPKYKEKFHTFKVNDLVLLYDNKFIKFLGKFQMHWLGPYIIKEIIYGCIVQLVKLNG